MFGVPNFSWIGAFEEVNLPSQTALEAALTPEQYAALQGSGSSGASSNGNGRGIPWWFIAAAVLLLVRR